jgi:acyl carrier protein
MDLTTFCSQLDELFELDAGTIQPATQLQQVDGWSSLTFMGLIALVDEEYGVTLAPNAVLECGAISELFGQIVAASTPARKAA